MLFPLYLLLSTAVTLIATWTNDFAPFGVPGLTRRTLGIDFGIKDGHFSLRVYGDDASEDNLMHLEPVVPCPFALESHPLRTDLNPPAASLRSGTPRTARSRPIRYNYTPF